MENREKISKVIGAFFVAIFLSLMISTFITSHMWENPSIITALRDMRKQVMLESGDYFKSNSLLYRASFHS